MFAKLIDALRSRTVIAALVTLAAVVADMFGFGSYFANQATIVDSLLKATEVGGTLAAIYFRVTPQWTPKT